MIWENVQAMGFENLQFCNSAHLSIQQHSGKLESILRICQSANPCLWKFSMYPEEVPEAWGFGGYQRYVYAPRA